LGDNLAF